jgi:stage V sporulation protein B
VQKQSFVLGTFVLVTSAFITRMLSFAQGIILARVLGAEGMGLLMMAHPLVPLIITVTGLGLPIAISKLVSEADVLGDKAKIRRIVIVSLVVTGTLSILFTLAALLGAKATASLLLTDQRAYYAMLALTPIAPIVAISGVLKGYFRGKQNMKPIAFSNVLEHVIHITFIVLLVQLLLPYGIEYAAAGAMVSSVIGEAAGLLYLLAAAKWGRKSVAAAGPAAQYIKHGKQTMLDMMQISLPAMGHGIIQSIYRAFQPILVTKSLAIAGVGTALATKQYGLLVGCAFPLLMLPSFITHSLSSALIPAVSEARATLEGSPVMHRRIDQAIRIGLIVGTPCTVIFCMWATPLTTVIYAPDAGPYLRLLAPIFFLHYFESPLHAVLLGLGRAGTAMWNFLMTTLLKVIAIFILGTEYGMSGVVLGLNFGICLITLLNFFSISGIVGFYLDFRNVIKVGISTIVMGLAGQNMFWFMQTHDVSMLWTLIAAVTVCLLVYSIALLLTGAIRSSEIRRMTYALQPRRVG